MIDVAFALQGNVVPEGYAFELWHEVVRVLPWLDAEELAGILPLRGAESGQGLLLAKRAKLVLRLPAGGAARAMALSGTALQVGSGVLQIGAASERPLLPYATLHAQLVESAEAEERFIDGVAAQLREMGIGCKWICGRHLSITGAGRSLSGYSLVLHDLTPEASLHLQRVGLGGSRRYGCGLFLPHKEISGLD